MNKRHLTYCLVIVAAISMLVITQGYGAALPWAALLLLCPLLMGAMMWLMMRDMRGDPHDHQTPVGHH